MPIRLGFGFAVILSTLSSPALADDRSGNRIAELIQMHLPAGKGSEGVEREGESAPPLAFTSFELSRTKNGEAMRADFVPNAGAGPSQELLPPFSAIAVPGWMRSPMLSAMPAPGFFVPGCAIVPYAPAQFLPAHVEARRRMAYDAMSSAACDAGVPVGLFDALVLAESAYNLTATSPKNAYGLAQLMPGTAAGLGVDRYDPTQNLRGGARYLRAQLDTFGQVPLALAAYNAGPGRVRGGRIPNIPETQNYVREVLEKWRRLTGRHRIATMLPFAAAPSRPADFRSVVPVATVHAF